MKEKKLRLAIKFRGHNGKPGVAASPQNNYAIRGVEAVGLAHRYMYVEVR